MNQIELCRAAIRTLRVGIIKKDPPGKRRDHLLARLEVIIEQSRRVTSELRWIDPFRRHRPRENG
jgi:hypothetical protein